MFLHVHKSFLQKMFTNTKLCYRNKNFCHGFYTISMPKYLATKTWLVSCKFYVDLCAPLLFH